MSAAAGLPAGAAGEVAWRTLTALPRKREIYTHDSHFREGWREAVAAWGAALPACLARTALVLFKVEAVAGRRIAPAVELLAARGFAPVAARRLRYQANVYHALYRHQLRRATLDKIRLYTRWAAGQPALLAAFVDTAARPPLPASVRLKAMKGHALVSRRTGDDLRSLLGSPNSIVNFLHCAEEPADLVRELPIFLPARERPAFWRDIQQADLAAGRASLRRLAAGLARDVPAHDVDARAAARRIRAIAAAAGAQPAVALLDAVLAGRERLDLYTFETTLEAIADRLAPIDVFAFGAEFIERDLPGVAGDLDDDPVAAWLVPG